MTTAYDERPRLSLGQNYRKLWSSSAASNLADGIFIVALPLIAVRLTDSPMLVAGVSLAGRLPWLVFVLFAGALADRLDRRITMRNVQLMRVAVVGLLAAMALTETLSLPVVYVAAFVLGVGETLFDTAAQSIMPSIVGRDLLSRANSRLYAVELTMNTLVGPPLGGFLVALSVPVALAGSTLGYGLAAIGLVLIAGVFKPTSDAPRRSMTAEIREGFGFLWHRRVLRSMALMVAIANTGNTALMAIFVLFVLAPGPMGLSEVGYGLLITTVAIGGVAGSLLEDRIERVVGRSNVMFGSLLVAGLAYLVPVFTTNALVIAVTMVAQGASFMMWNVVTVSLRQQMTPDHLLGRVNASYRLFAWGSMPIGAILGGLMAEVLGLRWVFILAALTTLVLLWFRRYLRDPDLDAAAVEHAAEAPDAATPA